MLFQENNVRHFLLCQNEGDNNDFVTLQLVLKKKKIFMEQLTSKTLLWRYANDLPILF